MFLFFYKHTQYLAYREFFSVKEAMEWGELHFGDWLLKYQSAVLDLSTAQDTGVKELFHYLGECYWACDRLRRMDTGRDALGTADIRFRDRRDVYKDWYIAPVA